MFTTEKVENYLKLIEELRTIANEYREWIEKYHPEPNAFVMIRNFLLMTYELLNHYNYQWIKGDVKKLKHDQIERVVTITRWAYIASFSIIEYVSKIIIRKINHEIFNNINERFKEGKRVYFTKILEIMNKNDLLDDNDYFTWDILKEIRNYCVHNNCISDKNGSYTIKIRERELLIKFEKDKGLIGEMGYFLKLTEILLEMHYRWFYKIIAINSL